MNSCIDELKAAREKLNLSLEDISIATKINVKFLQAIEEGNLHFLNEVYVRAFVRAYAKEVGLDPEVCIDKLFPKVAKLEDKASEKKFSSIPERQQEIITKARIPKQKGASQTTVLIVISILIITGFMIIINLFKEKGMIKDEEITFKEAVSEFESNELFKDSVEANLKLTTTDSLVLFISSNESCWIRVLIDDSKVRERLLLANESIVLKASDNFKITSGNAGALSLKLNNKNLDSIGKRGMVVRDFFISRKNLE